MKITGNPDKSCFLFLLEYNNFRYIVSYSHYGNSCGDREQMKEIKTERLLLQAFRELDYDDLFEYLSQLENDEFEGYPGITYENGREHLKYRIESGEFYAIELLDSGKVIGNIYCGSRDYEKHLFS